MQTGHRTDLRGDEADRSSDKTGLESLRDHQQESVHCQHTSRAVRMNVSI